MSRNYFAIDHNAHNLLKDRYKQGGSGDVLDDYEEFWSDDASLHEALQEASWDLTIFEALRAIRQPKKDVEAEYIEFAKLAFELVDNHLLKCAEDVNK